MNLDEPEFFVTFVLENFGKKSDFMVCPEVSFHSTDDVGSPFNNKRS